MSDSLAMVLYTMTGWVLAALLVVSPARLAAGTAQAALAAALRGTAATGVVVEVTSGRRLATVGEVNRVSAPGSILKPLFLAAALEKREVLPETSVFCRRSFYVTEGSRRWNLACSHPPVQTALNAREALAYSCNRYFAELADRMAPAQVALILRAYGLPGPAMSLSREQKELVVLGVAYIQVSPLVMAGAYRQLARELGHFPSPLDPVRDGLRESVEYGMAHHAAVGTMEILGKTGTASVTGRSHGWFAGIGSLDGQQVVVVIYLPGGNGGDAADLAQRFFLRTSSSR